jgi:serine/threonine-protein kinase
MVVDEYRILRLLGYGGMGRVYEAEDTMFVKLRALKLISPQYASNREAVRRFQNEAKSAGHLEHLNIAAVTDLGTTPDGLPYVVTELLQGQDCGRLLASKGPLQIGRACDIIYQACVGISIAHQAGIVHRDIKPQNLFLTQASDGSDLVKILDFGISKLRIPGANLAVTAGIKVDTLYYLAPEQVRDAGKVDGRADVWAIGVVLYELLTGRRPFEGPSATTIAHQIAYELPEPPNELRQELPAALVSALDLSLEKDPEKRFNNVLDLADAIAPFTGRALTRRSHLASSQRPPSPTPVDAAYDTTLSTAYGVTNAPVARTATANRERMHRVYSLLIVAALFGFAGGWLTRRVVNHTRAIAAVPTGYPIAQTGGLASNTETLSAPANPPVATVAPVATVVSHEAVVAAASTKPNAATSATSAVTSVPVRLVSATADAGTMRAATQNDTSTAVPASARNARVSKPTAAKASAQTAPVADSVSDKPKAEAHPTESDDVDNPL